MVSETSNSQNALLKAYNMLLYFAGSMVMYEPVEECIVDFWSNGIIKTLPVRSGNPRFMEAASMLRESDMDKTIFRKILKDDFSKLFSQASISFAPPLKSYYCDTIMEKATGKEDVGEFYNSYGWHKRTKYNMPDDNLGIELLFITLLNDKYIALDDQACRLEMGKEIRRFIRSHVLSWIPEWHASMQEHADTLCYKGISTLIYAVCEDICSLLEDSAFEADLAPVFRN